MTAGTIFHRTRTPLTPTPDGDGTTRRESATTAGRPPGANAHDARTLPIPTSGTALSLHAGGKFGPSAPAMKFWRHRPHRSPQQPAHIRPAPRPAVIVVDGVDVADVGVGQGVSLALEGFEGVGDVAIEDEVRAAEASVLAQRFGEADRARVGRACGSAKRVGVHAGQRDAGHDPAALDRSREAQPLIPLAVDQLVADLGVPLTMLSPGQCDHGPSGPPAVRARSRRRRGRDRTPFVGLRPAGGLRVLGARP